MKSPLPISYSIPFLAEQISRNFNRLIVAELSSVSDVKFTHLTKPGGNRWVNFTHLTYFRSKIC